MRTISFSSASLVPGLSDRRRYHRWRDIYADQFGPCEFAISDAAPFHANIEAFTVGRVGIGELSGTVTHAERTKRNIVDVGAAGRRLYINLGTGLFFGEQRNLEFSVEPGAAVLLSGVEPFKMHGGERNSWMSLVLPDETLDSAFRGADDRASPTVDKSTEALQLLKRYIEFVRTGPPVASAALAAHGAHTVTDLVRLAAGLGSDGAEKGGSGGLRAARLLAIENTIARTYRDPSASAHGVAVTLGLSTRYVYDLLQDTGFGFSERVTELRLEAARLMLGDRRYGAMRISEIALASGFSDISHFNRSFRRRFGCTPGSAR